MLSRQDNESQYIMSGAMMCPNQDPKSNSVCIPEMVVASVLASTVPNPTDKDISMLNSGAAKQAVNAVDACPFLAMALQSKTKLST